MDTGQLVNDLSVAFSLPPPSDASSRRYLAPFLLHIKSRVEICFPILSARPYTGGLMEVESNKCDKKRWV